MSARYLGTKAACAGNTMQVRVRVLRHVVVEHDIHALDIHAATEQVGGDQNTLRAREKNTGNYYTSLFKRNKIICVPS